MRITHSLLLAFVLALAGSAHASLITSDFLVAGDQLLATDTATGLQWLTPVYTSNHSYDDSFVQSIITTYGFTYATEAQVLDMIDRNFNNPPLSPGDYTGYQDALEFFNVFGTPGSATCGDPAVPCPRIQGLTSTVTSAGTHDADGMIYVGTGDPSTVGYLISQNAWPDTAHNVQMGSWLVRTATPEPASLTLAAIGMALIAARVRLRRRT